jgi:hypothetical protein
MGKDKKQSVKTADKKEKAPEVVKEKKKNVATKTIKSDSKVIKKSVKKDKVVDPERKKKRMTSRFNKLRLKNDGNGKGIVYVGHLPRGFAEKELKGFFA